MVLCNYTEAPTLLCSFHTAYCWILIVCIFDTGTHTMYIYVCICACVCLCVCIYACVTLCVHACVNVCIYIYICKIILKCHIDTLPSTPQSPPRPSAARKPDLDLFTTPPKSTSDDEWVTHSIRSIKLLLSSLAQPGEENMFSHKLKYTICGLLNYILQQKVYLICKGVTLYQIL